MGQTWYASSLTQEGPRLWERKKKNWEKIQQGIFNYPFQLKQIVFGNQNIWVTSDRGLVCYKGGQGRLFDGRYGLSRAVSCVFVDHENAIWVGSVNHGLYVNGEPPSTELPKQASVLKDGIQLDETLKLYHATFQQSSSVLKDSLVYKELQVLVDFLHENPTISIEVHGHTDHTGSQMKNWELSKKRAWVIADLLYGLGVDSQRVIVKWHGENKPFLPNTSEENKQLNRRVEIKLVDQR